MPTLDLHPFSNTTREQFLGSPKITSDANGKDLLPSGTKQMDHISPEPFPVGDQLSVKYCPNCAAVYNAKGVVIASYSFGDTLVVNKSHRRQGIGSELVYQWRMRYPQAKPATARTKKSQALQVKVWQRIEAEVRQIERSMQSPPTLCIAQHEQLESAPPGTWIALPYPDIRGRPIAQIQELDANTLTLPELDEQGRLQPEKRAYLSTYLSLLQQGRSAPTIDVVETNNGQMRVTDGHRRAMAARVHTTSTIRSLVHPLIEVPGFGKVPLTLELAQAYPHLFKAITSVKHTMEPTQDTIEQALDHLTVNDLEDDQVFSKPLPSAQDADLTYLTKLGANPSGFGGFHVYVRGDGVRAAGPHEFFFFDNSDQPIGLARMTKSETRASINMIAFVEDERRCGHATAFYTHILSDWGIDVRSDSQITDATALLYKKLSASYPCHVDPDGRIVLAAQPHEIDSPRQR